jgi:hypothetical protein
MWNLLYWAHSLYHLKTDIERSLRNVVFEIKARTIGNVENCETYVIIPSSQTYRWH